MKSERGKVVFALPLLGHPRDSKRIAMLEAAGFEVEAVAFDREYHSGRMPNCPVESLGKITHGRYLHRIFKILSVLQKIRRVIKRNQIVYASGTDMAYMALFAGLGLGKPIVIEIGDIRELQVAEGLKGRIVRMLDKLFVDCCSLLVSTSAAFVDNYYRQWLKTKIPALIIENKLEPDFCEKVRQNGIFSPLCGKPLVDRPLRIGYFGLLRCEWSWNVLKGIAKARPKDIEIVLAGYPINPVDLPEQIKNYDNIKFRGQYHSPQDLPDLYGSVDLNWACYKPIGKVDWNLRWARPNRFYESCFFHTPIITRAGSYDSGKIAQYQIGLVIDDEEVEKVVEKLSTITPEDLTNWKNNMRNLPCSIYTYTTETAELKEAIERLIKKRME
jgi:succinoglycan biosynthesis protein ExoL